MYTYIYIYVYIYLSLSLYIYIYVYTHTRTYSISSLGGHHRVQAHRDADEAGFELTVSVDFGLLVGDIGQFYCLYKLFTTGVAALFASEVATVSKRIGMQYNIAYHTIIYYNIHVCMYVYIYIYITQHIYIYIYI